MVRVTWRKNHELTEEEKKVNKVNGRERKGANHGRGCDHERLTGILNDEEMR